MENSAQVIDGRRKGIPTLLAEAAFMEAAGWVFGKIAERFLPFLQPAANGTAKQIAAETETTIFESSVKASRFGSIGDEYAGLARAYQKSIPEELRRITVAVTKVDNVQYVAINGGAKPEAIKLLGDIVRRQGGKFYVGAGAGPAGHAERALYEALKMEPNLVIGISREAGMCPSCEAFFTNKPNVKIVPFNR